MEGVRFVEYVNMNRAVWCLSVCVCVCVCVCAAVPWNERYREEYRACSCMSSCRAVDRGCVCLYGDCYGQCSKGSKVRTVLTLLACSFFLPQVRKRGWESILLQGVYGGERVGAARAPLGSILDELARRRRRGEWRGCGRKKRACPCGARGHSRPRHSPFQRMRRGGGHKPDARAVSY
jgi:hypothetical protein